MDDAEIREQELHDRRMERQRQEADTLATLRARIAELEAERDRLREALEKKGAADVYRDGFDAALRTADSFRAHVEWGPYVTPQNAFNEGVNQLRSVLREARAALAPKPGGTDHERD